MGSFVCLYLGRDPIKVLPQHPPHVFACVRGHLMLKQEGELATFSDAVEVAVDLVIFTTCQRENSNSCKLSVSGLIRLRLIARHPKPAKVLKGHNPDARAF